MTFDHCFELYTKWAEAEEDLVRESVKALGLAQYDGTLDLSVDYVTGELVVLQAPPSYYPDTDVRKAVGALGFRTIRFQYPSGAVMTVGTLQ